MAETTTATSWPASTSRLTWRATLRMRSRSATDVPPNFITKRAITFPDAPKGANKRPARVCKPQRRPQKARIHTGGVACLQLSPLFLRDSPNGEQKSPGIVDRYRRDRAVFEAGFDLVGCARADGGAAQAQPDPAGLYPRQGGGTLRPRPQEARLPKRSAHAR